jgi:hypothetical protein
MADGNDLHSLLNESFLQLEPVVVLGDELYVKTDRSDDDVNLVTAMGVKHPLRRLCSKRTLDEQFVRRNAEAVGRLIRAGLARARADNQLDDLRYFVEGLLPAFQGRDWSEHFELDMFTEPAEPTLFPDVVGQIDELSRAFSTPVLPSPSYLLLGRFRMLRPDPAASGGDHVLHGCEILGPTGETISVGQVDRRWRDAVSGFVAHAVDRLVDAAVDLAPGSAVITAREEIARTGCLQRGDLIFLAGSPSRVGHVLPPHYNRVLGRQSHRDLAMMVALTRPPRIETPQVFVRNGQGPWVPFHLPHGLCLGGSPPDIRPETPGLALLAYLRWAACRIASNGAFHANDDQSTEYDS